MTNADIAYELRTLYVRNPGLTLDELNALDRAALHYEAMDQADLLDVEQPD